jgi:hypothetical protein
MSEITYMASTDFAWIGSVLTLITILALAAGIVMMSAYDSPSQEYRLGQSMFWVSLVVIIIAMLIMGGTYGFLYFKEGKSNDKKSSSD